MRIHLHTLCWNDRPMLDFFFRHYHWVDHFFVFDDGSTDGTREYLEARPDVTLATTPHADPDSWVLSAQRIYDTDWKRSIGKADWVVITNIDEHLHHPSMRTHLEEQQDVGVTVVPALGYQMILDAFPAPDALLWRDHPMGAPWRKMSKAGIFRPATMRNSNFAPGRHSARFEGLVVLPDRDDVVNLHYKYLGLAETQARHEQQAERMGQGDAENRWDTKYRWTMDQLGADFEAFRTALVDTSATDHHRDHLEPRWWSRRWPTRT